MKYRGDSLGKRLIEEGLCPKNARLVELHIPASGALTLHYEVFVDTEDIPKIIRALQKMHEADPIEGFAGLPESEQPA